MLITIETCPLCERHIHDADLRCPHCQAVIQLTPARPEFSRTAVNEAAIQATIDRCREQLHEHSNDGYAHYVLGLAYLNLGITDQGIQELRQATTLLPEKHTIRFELAILGHALGKDIAALEDIQQALQLAPENRDYAYLQRYVQGTIALNRGVTHEAIQHWIAAYQLYPEASLAREALQGFVAQHEAKLQQPIARTLPTLSPQDAASLQLILSRSPNGQVRLPRRPRKPRDLGKWSMELLRRMSATRAAALEQMHAERIDAYNNGLTTYEAQRQAAETQNQAAHTQWQERVQAARSDLPLMARLCLAIVEEEARRQEEARRKEELRQEAEQKRLAQQQQAEHQRLAQQQLRAQSQSMPNARSVAPIATQPVGCEKRYFATSARYVQGLPAGKQGDMIQLTVSNHRVVIQHKAIFGGWEYTIPLQALVEATDDPVKHMLSSEHRLRLSYRDQQGMVAHAIFSNLKVQESIKKILQARTSA